MLPDKLGSGCFTIDKNGRIIMSTLTHNFPLPLAKEVARQALNLIQSAQGVQMPINTLTARYKKLTICVHPLMTGAIIYVTPAFENPFDIMSETSSEPNYERTDN